MKKMDYREFYDFIVPRLFEVAVYQKMMCGRADNLGKDAQSDVTQNDIHGALTYIDQFTQDYIILPIYQKWPDLVPLVEEDTGLKRSNIDNVSDYSLIMDPIDGTAFYIRGDKDYSLMLGVMYKGEMALGLICYPEDDLIIGVIKGQGAWHHKKNGTITALSNLDSVQISDSAASCHYRFAKEPYLDLHSKLTNKGYTLATNDNGFGTNATGVLRITEGSSCAFIAPHISLHDFGIPALVIEELGGAVRLYEYNGLDDVSSWSTLLKDYGSPSPKVSNPRFRVIIADSEATIDEIVTVING